jgi:hypothetical protein
MPDISQIKEHMDVISSDRKTVGKVDHLEGSDKIKLTKQSSPDGQHHHFVPIAWVDHVDQHVHLNKSGADITARTANGSIEAFPLQILLKATELLAESGQITITLVPLYPSKLGRPGLLLP